MLRQLELAVALELALSLPLDPAGHDPAQHDELVDLVDRAVDELRGHRERPDELPDAARREWYLTDIMLAAFRGLLADGVLRDPRALDAIDHHDFSEWLIRHGASPESARCGLVTTLMYDLPFAYEDGDPHKPAIGAGTALRGAIRTLFTYTGAIAWKMRAGMGDIVFAPMFEVLQRRGVRFEFFHRVEALHPSADGCRVESIDMSVQATLRDPDPDAALLAARLCPRRSARMAQRAAQRPALHAADGRGGGVVLVGGEAGAGADPGRRLRLRQRSCSRYRSARIRTSARSSSPAIRSGRRWSSIWARSTPRPSRSG